MLFGPRVHHTLDPKNVETVLSTSFESKSERSRVYDANVVTQSLGLARAEMSSSLYWAMGSLLRKVQRGSSRGNSYGNNSLERNTKTWTIFGSM